MHAQLTRARCRPFGMMSYRAETSDCDYDGESFYEHYGGNDGEGKVKSTSPLVARLKMTWTAL